MNLAVQAVAVAYKMLANLTGTNPRADGTPRPCATPPQRKVGGCGNGWNRSHRAAAWQKRPSNLQPD